MPNNPTVTVIVLNYNGLKHLQDCFVSLTKIKYPAELLELMLVDNASSDGSVEYIQAHYPSVRIVRNAENVGFGSGNNIGARAATGQYVVFLNNDMWVEPDFVAGLVAAIQSEPGAVCAGAKILNWDGSLLDFAGAGCHFAGYGYQQGMGKPFRKDQHRTVKPILFACGGAMMIDRQVFLDVGGFDGDYFIYYEDSDLGWRLWVLGYKVVFAPDAIVCHRHHGTMDGFSSYRKALLYKRNALWSVIKNYEEDNLRRVLPAMLLGSISGVVDSLVRGGKIDREDFFIKNASKPSDSVGAFDKQQMSTLLAAQEVIEKLPQVMEKRRWIQEKRRRSDHEVAQLFRWPFGHWPEVSRATQYAVSSALGVQQIFAHLPRRVLVISAEVVPYPGLAASAAGLRAWGLGQGLTGTGHEVIFSLPRAAICGRERLLPEEAARAVWDSDTVVPTVLDIDPDIIVACGWEVLDALPTDQLPVPVLLDQPRPMPERGHGNGTDGEEDVRVLLRALGKADFVSCDGETFEQLQSWLERAGWTAMERRERTAAIAVPLSADVSEHQPAKAITPLDHFIRHPSMRWRPPPAAQPVSATLPLHQRVHELEQALNVVSAQRDQLEQTLNAVLTSRSWRYGAPVRAVLLSLQQGMSRVRDIGGAVLHRLRRPARTQSRGSV